MAKQWWEKEQKQSPIGYDNTPEQNRNNLNTMYKQVMEYKPFEYDLASDPRYKQLSDRYMQMGKTAMQDTMGQAAALTGGYGNSFAQNVGQQAYQQYLTALSDQIPTLYTQAYDQWAGDFDRLLQMYELTAMHPENMAALTPRASSSGSSSGGFADLIRQVGASGALAATASAGLPSVSSVANPLLDWYYQRMNAK